jgi:hypothetical protein
MPSDNASGPADRTGPEDGTAPPAADYPEARYALEHCNCALVEGPHREEDHPEVTA